MKVNVYDAENVQKGRLMLLNIAEDLKEYAKITVAPINDKQDSKKSSSSKPLTLDEMKGMAQRRADEIEDANLVALDEDIDDGQEDDLEDRPSYLYMELQSTAMFKDVDIDKMLQHTTLDDFLRGLYVNKPVA